MNHRNGTDDVFGGRMRGFVAFVAVVLWFLLAILSAGRAAAEDVSLTAGDILPSLEAVLTANGAPADGIVQLDNPAQPVGGAAVAHASYNPLSGRFVLRMAQGAGAVTGIVARMQRYAVVNREMDRGEIIGEADLSYFEAPGASTRSFVTDAETLLGKSARRPLAANKPIRAGDLETPTLVKKGAVVTLTYQVDGLRMTHQGVAMHNGAAGDIVSVRNIKSDRTLKGVVADRNLVSIIPHHAAFEG